MNWQPSWLKLIWWPHIYITCQVILESFIKRASNKFKRPFAFQDVSSNLGFSSYFVSELTFLVKLQLCRRKWFYRSAFQANFSRTSFLRSYFLKALRPVEMELLEFSSRILGFFTQGIYKNSYHGWKVKERKTTWLQWSSVFKKNIDWIRSSKRFSSNENFSFWKKR